MKNLKLVVASLLLCAVTAHAQEVDIPEFKRDRVHDFSKAVLWGGTGFDVGTTMMGLKPGAGYREANPFLRKLNRPQIAAVAVGHTVFTHWLSEKMKRDGHPRIAKILNFVVGGVHLGAGVWNAAQPAPKR